MIVAILIWSISTIIVAFNIFSLYSESSKLLGEIIALSFCVAGIGSYVIVLTVLYTDIIKTPADSIEKLHSYFEYNYVWGFGATLGIMGFISMGTFLLPFFDSPGLVSWISIILTVVLALIFIRGTKNILISLIIKKQKH